MLRQQAPDRHTEETLGAVQFFGSAETVDIQAEVRCILGFWRETAAIPEAWR